MKKIFISILSIISLALILWVVALFSGKASLNDTQVLKAHDNGSSKIEYELTQSDGNIPQQTQLIPLTVQNQQNDHIVSEIQMLTERWYKANIKPGWIHVIVHINNDYDIATTLPDNKTIDNDYLMEDWILLDANGNQVRAVNIMRSMDGSPIQIAILQDNTWNNLTYNIISPVAEETLPLKFALDSGFPDQANRLSSSLTREITYLDNKLVTLFTVTEKYDPPMKFLDFTELVSTNKTRAYYDPNSGALLLYEQLTVMANGTERISNSAKIEKVDVGIEPPTDVLSYLK